MAFDIQQLIGKYYMNKYTLNIRKCYQEWKRVVSISIDNQIFTWYVLVGLDFKKVKFGSCKIGLVIWNRKKSLVILNCINFDRNFSFERIKIYCKC